PQVIGGVFASVAPWASGTTQVNFFGRANPASERPTSWAPDVVARLREVRRKHDPSGRFPFALHGTDAVQDHSDTA
ncbi:MAG TPA: hypothetical protein VN241_00860, partial [Microbacterium sp.]|nr:hypothetical protein [Microbacterium sp.]